MCMHAWMHAWDGWMYAYISHTHTHTQTHSIEPLNYGPAGDSWVVRGLFVSFHSWFSVRNPETRTLAAHTARLKSPAPKINPGTPEQILKDHGERQAAGWHLVPSSLEFRIFL